MLTDYIKTAMKQAEFERLRDGTIYGHIPGFAGVWANAKMEAACRRELQEVLEEWMLFRLKHGLPLPVVEEEELDLNKVAAPGSSWANSFLPKDFNGLLPGWVWV